MQSNRKASTNACGPSGPVNRFGWSSPKPRYSRTLPAALREGQEVDVALGADRLQLLIEVVGAVDEHAGEVVVRRVRLELEPERPADHRVASVGADEQPRRRLVRAGRIAPRDRRLRLQRDRDVRHAPPGVGTVLRRRVEQRLAGIGVALRHRAVDPGQERQLGGRGEDLVGIERRVERGVAADEVAARGGEVVEHAESLGLGDAPRGDPFALRAIGELLGALEDEARPPGSLHRGGQRRSADAAADDHEVVGLRRHGG